jgi:hypothetical protein
VGEAAVAGGSAVAAGLAAGAVTALYPTATSATDTCDAGACDPGSVFYHGTSVGSGLALLRGAPLSADVAAANKIDGPAGSYLATDPASAEFFAARRAPGTVLQYNMSGPALRSLMSGGSTLGPIPQGNFPTQFPGAQLVVPPNQFSQFNALRGSGAITVSPYRAGQ